MDQTAAFLAIVNAAKANIRECTVADVVERQSRGESFHFIDVREESEYAAGHAKGAIHIGKGIIERDIERLIPDMGAPLVLYCGGGFRSALATETIQKMGYSNAISMDGGMRAWLEAGLPEER